MSIENSSILRGQGLLRTFEASFPEGVASDGENLMGWLDQKVSEGGLSYETALSYKRWIGAALEAAGHPAADAIRKWRSSPQPQSGGQQMEQMQLGRLESTNQLRAKSLLESFTEQTGKAVGSDGANLLEWMNKHCNSGSWSPTSANCYRRWLAGYSESLGHPAAVYLRAWIPPNGAEQALVADQEDARALALSDLDVSETNESYYAYLGSDSMKLLLRQLVEPVKSSGRPRYDNGEEIALFMVVTAMTGLRPGEWPSARLLETFHDPETRLTLGPVLEVRTLKQSNRREDNPLKAKRHLLLDRWPLEQIEQLKVFLAVVNEVLSAEGEEGFRLYLKRNREQLRRAWKRLVKQSGEAMGPGGESQGDMTVTFYTCRHIFAEEVRRAQTYTRFELAAMMGHSLLTNQAFYGPRDATMPRGFDFTLPRPWPGDAEDIQRWDYQVNPFRMKAGQGDMFRQSGHEEGHDQEKSLDRFFLR